MKKSILSAMALAFAFALPAAAQDGLLKKYDRRLTTPRNYVCYRTTEKMKIDGKLNEKVWQKAAQTESFVDISGFDFPKPSTTLRRACFGTTSISTSLPCSRNRTSWLTSRSATP